MKTNVRYQKFMNERAAKKKGATARYAIDMVMYTAATGGATAIVENAIVNMAAPKGKTSKWKRFCYGVGGTAIGGIVGDKAGEYMLDMMSDVWDGVDELQKLYTEMKGEFKK